MINGRFETFTKRPVVDCFITLTYFKLSGVVPFLIDTGADSTLLMPADARRLNIDYSKLIYSRTATGVGGDCREHLAPATLIVADQRTAYGYRFPLGIAEPKDDLEDCPSLLGMDILRYWRIICDYSERLLQIEIKMSDEERPL